MAIRRTACASVRWRHSSADGWCGQTSVGSLSRFTYAQCHEALWEVEDGSMLRLRCHVGHAFTAGSVLRSHQERATLAHRMAEQETPAHAAEHGIEIMRKRLRSGAAGSVGRR